MVNFAFVLIVLFESTAGSPKFTISESYFDSIESCVYIAREIAAEVFSAECYPLTQNLER